jgi:molybdopterin-guanine dinucleotide biosynthesis protein A
MALCGAILIGGRSRRMGADKATLVLRDGRTMVEHVAEALAELCDEVLLVGSARGNLGGKPGHAGGYVTIADTRTDAGPLGGIEALLMSNHADEYLVCPCDVPAATAHVLRGLLERRDAPATVLRIHGRDHFEPLPARIHADALASVTRLLDSGERSVWRLMEELPAAIVEVGDDAVAALRNINTPDDLSTP